MEDQLNQLTVQLMSERKELRNLQLENVRLETELNEASQRLEEQQIENQRNESQLQSEMSKLIDNLRDEKVILGGRLSRLETFSVEDFLG